MSVYPPAVSYFARRVMGCSTNCYKLEPNGSPDGLGAGQIITFELPTNTLLDMKSIKFMCGAKTNGGTCSRLPNKIDSLIERISVEAGGLTIAQGFPQYNTVKHVKSILTEPLCKSSSLTTAMNHENIPRVKSDVDGGAVGNSEDYSSATNFAVGDFLGFLGECYPQVIDTALLPNLVLKIHLAPNAVIPSAVGTLVYDTDSNSGSFGVSGQGEANYTLNKVHLLATVYGIMDGQYDRMVESKIVNEGFLEVPFKSYQTFTDGQHSGSSRFNLGCASLDKLYAVWRPSGGYSGGGLHPVLYEGMRHKGTAGERGFVGSSATATTTTVDVAQTYGVVDFEAPEFNGEKYTANYFNFPKPAGLTTAQFNINGTLYPQFQAEPGDWLALTNEAMEQKDNQIRCKKWWDNHMHIYAVRLNLPESDKLRILSGLDTRSINLSGMFNTTGVSGTVPLTIIAEYTSVLRIGSGLQLSLVI